MLWSPEADDAGWALPLILRLPLYGLQDGCSGSWGLCLTSSGALQRSLGSYYTDLPSNMLGSFIMGLLATTAALGLPLKQVGGQPRCSAGGSPATLPHSKDATIRQVQESDGAETAAEAAMRTHSLYGRTHCVMLSGSQGHQMRAPVPNLVHQRGFA